MADLKRAINAVAHEAWEKDSPARRKPIVIKNWSQRGTPEWEERNKDLLDEKLAREAELKATRKAIKAWSES